MTLLRPARIKALLNLEPLPTEGGFYCETYRSAHSTAIYYFLEPQTCSRMHRLEADEIYHYYLGDCVELLTLPPDGESRVVRLGPEIEDGQVVQHVVPAGTWQGARLQAGGTWALLGTTMAPAFTWGGFELGHRADLVGRYPEAADRITGLTAPE